VAHIPGYKYSPFCKADTRNQEVRTTYFAETCIGSKLVKVLAGLDIKLGDNRCDCIRIFALLQIAHYARMASV